MTDLVARDLAALWHPCSQMRDYLAFPPLEVVSARGSRLTLADGREIIDAIASWWCKSLGHGHPRLRAALTEQAAAFEHVILANTTNAPVVRLCERILALANGLGAEAWGPGAAPGRRAGWFGKVFFADNGSTGVEVALKLALQAQAQLGHPRRTRFAAFAGGYHGETMGALSVGDCGLYKDTYAPLLFPCTMLGGLPHRAGPDAADWDDAAREWPAIEAQLAPLADVLAAIVYEPILQGAGGMRLHSPDLLRRLRAWADAQGVLLIADEIAAGMGRCGTMLASHLAGRPLSGRAERGPTAGIFGPPPAPLRGGPPDAGHLGALPDIAVLSKGLTGGFLPLSAVLITDRLFAVFDADHAAGKAFLHSNTYAGNALAVAVANAALDVYAEEDVLGQVARRGPLLRAGLADLARGRPRLREVRGVGMMAAVDLRAADGSAIDPARRTGYRVFQEAVRRGALLRPLGDTMYLFPPLTMGEADIAAMLGILAASVDAVVGE